MRPPRRGPRANRKSPRRYGAGRNGSKAPPALLRVARAFDELRDATLAALSGHPVSKGVMRWVETSVERDQQKMHSFVQNYGTKGLPPGVLRAQAPTQGPARAPRPASVPARAGGDKELGKGPRAIMTVIAQAGPGGATRQQIAVLTGYKTRSITTYVSAGRQLGYIEPGSLVATPSGIAALGPDYKALPTGDALRQHWLEKLPQGELRLFEVILSCYPGGASRSKMKEMTGYAERSITTYVSKLVSRQIIRKVGREWCAADVLFTRSRGAA